MPSVSSLEQAARALSRGPRARAAAHDRRRPDHRRPRPDPRARGRRPHVHGRGGHPPVGAPARAGAGTASGCRSTRRETRPSARSSPETSPGPLRHRFGAPRDLVLGVTLVLADGTIANAGGKVVKNVAGYDLARLVCGSEGRFALIARVSLRLHPLPKAARTLAVETDDARGAIVALLALPAAAERARRPAPGRHPRALRGLSSRSRGTGRSRAGPGRRRRGRTPRSGTCRASPTGRGRAGASASIPGDSATRSRSCARRSCVPPPASRTPPTRAPSRRGCYRARARAPRSERIRRELDPNGVLAA